MPKIKMLLDLANYLESNNGRDRVMRLLYYTSQFLSGLSKPGGAAAAKFDIIANQLSSCRTVLRLFDDVPMLSYTLSYGSGREEPTRALGICGMSINILDQIYYPLEHIAWAAECNLLPLKSHHWWTATSACWAISTFLRAMKSMWLARCLLMYKNAIMTDSEYHQFMRMYGTKLSKSITVLLRNEFLIASRCLLDFVNAVHWLPPGMLWSGQLQPWQIGALGIMSSLLSIYHSIHK